MHIPVLLKESISSINPQDGDIIIDATFGGGGHTKAMLDKAHCTIHAIDNDYDARERARDLQKIYNRPNDTRLHFYNNNFANLLDIFCGNIKFKGILFDFGVSSFQLDHKERGFSFMRDGPLDMRMNCIDNEITAEHVLNTYAENDLAQIIYSYGDETRARKIAKAIVQARNTHRLSTTHNLRDIIHKACGTQRTGDIDSATKTFQAIRIYVNDELRSIQKALDSLHHIMQDGANIVTISFHSLEDRIVKNWATAHKNKKQGNFTIEQVCDVIRPQEHEVKVNPRSRSAIMRHCVIHF